MPNNTLQEIPLKACNKNLLVLLSIALIIITLAVYWQVGGHEFFFIDDHLFISNNVHVKGGLTKDNIIWAFTRVPGIGWLPMTWLSHMADVQMYGLNPRGHHLTNVFIHIAATLILFILLFRITNSDLQSAFVAALFALHPLHVESVAWMAERRDVLSAFFGFLTLLLYAEFVTKRRLTLYLLSLLSFAAGLMSKPILMTLPAIMMLLDFWPLERYSLYGRTPEQERRFTVPHLILLLKEKIPFFACSLISFLITISVPASAWTPQKFSLPSLGLRIANATTAYLKYIFKMLWPTDLAVYYPFPLAVPSWQVIGSLFILITITVIIIRARRRQPYLVTGWFWYLIMLVPVLNIIKLGDYSIADRYTYLSYTGLFIAVAWGVPVLIKEIPYRKETLALLAGAVILGSASISFRQIGYWRDSISLLRHTIQVTSSNVVAYNNLGHALENKGYLDAAIKVFQGALTINPNSFEVHNNLGIVLHKKRDLVEAIMEFKIALTIDPYSFEAHNNLGNALADKGELDVAVKEYQEAMKIDPNNAEVHNNLGAAFTNKGNLDAAIKEYKMALAIKPSYFEAHNNLGYALANKGDLDAAVKEYQEALRINPNYSLAHYNLEISLSQKRMHYKIVK